MSNAPDERIALLEKLKKSKGREVLVEDLESKLEVIERNILDNVQAEFNEQKFSQWDMEKTKRAFLKLLITYPDSLIDQFTPVEDPDAQELLEKAEFVDIG